MGILEIITMALLKELFILIRTNMDKKVTLQLGYLYILCSLAEGKRRHLEHLRQGRPPHRLLVHHCADRVLELRAPVWHLHLAQAQPLLWRRLPRDALEQCGAEAVHVAGRRGLHLVRQELRRNVRSVSLYSSLKDKK